MKKLLLILFMVLIPYSLNADGFNTPQQDAEKYYNKSKDASNIEKKKELIDKIIQTRIQHQNLTSGKQEDLPNRLSIMVSTSAAVLIPFLYLLGIVMTILSIKNLFIDDPNRSENGYSSLIISGTFKLIFAMILLNADKIINTWLLGEVTPWILDGGDFKKYFITLALQILFTGLRVFGIMFIVIGIMKIIGQSTQQQYSLFRGFLFIMGGALMIMYDSVISWIGGF